MVGREAEQKRIAHFLSEGKHGHAVCLITGEAGMGKTVLLEHARVAARRRGFAVLGARPDESEADLPFSGLGDLLESAGDLPGGELRRLVVTLRSGKPLDPRTFPAAVARLLRTLSQRRPLLIALDDLQWLDNSSWRALRFALRRLDGCRVAVAAVARGADDSARALAVIRAAPGGRAERIRLEQLPDEAVEELLRSRDLLPPGRAALRRLLDSAGGNPYFALELAAEWHGAWEDRQTLPAGLAAALRAQLAELPPLVVRSLTVVALESGVTRELVEELLGRGATTAVDDALARGLLLDAGVKGIRLAHPLLGAAALELTQQAALRRLRLRLARSAPDPVARGLHLARASVRADAAAAATIEAAATLAQRRGASSEAAQLHAHAARLTPAADADDRSRRLVASADLHAAAGETREALATLESLAGSLEPGSLRASVLARLGALRYRVDRADAAIETFRAGLDEVADDARTKVDLLRRLSLATMMSGDLGGAASIAAEASAAASPAELSETRAFEAMVHVVTGHRGAAKRVLGRGSRTALPATPFGVPAELRAATIRALASNIELGCLHGAAELDRLCRRAERDGDHGSLPYLFANLCEADLARGAWDEADTVAARAAPFLDDEPDGMTAFLFAALARLAVCRGRLADAERLAAQGLELGRRANIVPAIHANAGALGLLESTRDRHEAVDAHVGSLVAGMAALGLGEPLFARFVPDQIEALVRLGRLDAARDALAWWEERGRVLERPFALATAARCRALLHAAEGDRAAAEAALGAAADRHALLGEPFEQARTDLVAAEVHRRARRRGRAHAAVEAAAATFEALGAPAWARKADAEKARLGTRPRAAAGAALTETEQRIAGLVAAGRTNREIAQAIFVANSTVEAALWRIYRKLDLRSRTELTRWHLDAAAARPRRADRAGATPRD